MFNSKSFDLNNDEISKQPDIFNEPQRAQWLKYIITPVAVGFVLLLIIANIDFSSEPPHKDLRPPIPSFPFSKYAEWCQINCHTHKVLHCDSSLANSLIGIEEMNSSMDCSDYLLLRIDKYNFSDGVLRDDAFATGEYSLKSLVLYNCPLRHINDGTFDQNNLGNLLYLEVINSNLKQVTKLTFQGLNKLHNFTLINRQKSLKCNAFLSPLSHTVHSVKINQQYTKYSIYKPEDFFGLAIYEKLQFLDLMGNNFGGTLETKSFRNMPALEFLNLADCRLTSIDIEISNGVLNALRYLDLSGNLLKELGAPFIHTSMELGISLNLLNNNWSCINAKFELFKSLEIIPCIESVENTRSLVNANVLDSSDAKTEAEFSFITLTTLAVTTLAKQGRDARPKTTSSSSTKSSPTTPAESTTESLPTPPAENPTVTVPTPRTDSTTVTLPTTTPEVTEPTTITTALKTTTDKIITENIYGQVECFNAFKETVSTIMIFDNAKIAFTDDTESSLIITITQVFVESWTLIYFENSTITSQVGKYDSVNNPSQTTVIVDDLSCATSYVFCLIFEEHITSPFNCRSHQTLPCAITLRLSWFEANSSLIIGLSIVGILLSVLIGLLAIYGVLWLRPHWLCGSKRLQRSESGSHRMVLLPRSFEKDHYGAEGRNPNHENTITEYAEHYNNLEKAQLYQGGSNKYSIPPKECAPSAPEGKSSIKSTDPNGYTYESFNLYEELK